MITMEDCLGFCDLNEEEILAIAEHEQMPEIVAIVFGHYLARMEGGPEVVCEMIVDDIRDAQRRGDCDHVRTLLHVLHHFLRTHPEATPARHPWHTVF